jgi:septal ring factor EnvC (AmiA/AmiB activator)
MLTPGRIKPAIPFSEAKGLLPLPAQGRWFHTAKRPSTAANPRAWCWNAPRRPGRVAQRWWIVYAGDFRSYGQLLIINAGGGYHILLAGLSQIDGNRTPVLAGEPVGG